MGGGTHQRNFNEQNIYSAVTYILLTCDVEMQLHIKLLLLYNKNNFEYP